MATTTKANSVPMFTSVGQLARCGVKPATIAMITPSRMVGRCGVLKRGWTWEKKRGQQAVAAHREEDPGLAEQQDHADRGQADGGAEADEARETRGARWP